jgi:hypothetical protein
MSPILSVISKVISKAISIVVVSYVIPKYNNGRASELTKAAYLFNMCGVHHPSKILTMFVIIIMQRRIKQIILLYLSHIPWWKGWNKRLILKCLFRSMVCWHQLNKTLENCKQWETHPLCLLAPASMDKITSIPAPRVENSAQVLFCCLKFVHG